MGNHNQSFRDVFVTNNPALLTSGDSTHLAVGQLGIFNYDPKKDRLAVATPNLQVNKAIQLIIGTPPVPTNLLGAVADQSKVSKPIKGKKILSWSGRAAQRGQTQIIAVGYDGFDQTKTLTAQCEQSKDVFVKLTGGPIDQAFHTEGRGLVRQYSIFSGCCDDCGNDCAFTSAEAMADDLINQINNDPILSLGSATNTPYTPGNIPTNKLIRARKIVGAAAPSPDATGTQYLLAVCDNGDDTSLGAVQSQYPGVIVTRISRTGSTSTYQIVLPSASAAPASFNDSGLPIINDCPTCPTGYTLVASQFAAKITRQDAGDAGALTTLKSNYSITGLETASRLTYQFGQSTYIVTTTAEISAPFAGTDFLQQLGVTRNSCVLTTPSLIAWAVGQTWIAFNRTFSITLEDNVCGTSRLAELQAAYPDLTIVDNGAGTGTACVHNFSTVIVSAFAAPGCPADAAQWTPPDAYNGILWTPAPLTETNTVVGVLVESAYVDLITNECAYMFWRYDAEPIFIEVSQHDQDYNGKPTICAGDWAVTEIQPVALPIGVGSQVRDVEIYYKGYERKYWDINPIVRQYQDSIVIADPLQYYDQYTIGFEFDYHEFWFSEKFTDSYRAEVYFPEGTGKQFQEAINAYVASIGIDLEPVEIV
jgi:hypothetical protein